MHKDEKLHAKLRKNYNELLELEDLIRIKYQKRFIDSGLMTVTSLPDQNKFNLGNINSKEAFKRAIDIFLQCLLLDIDSANNFNYVCREVLEFLELGTTSKSRRTSDKSVTKDIIP